MFGKTLKYIGNTKECLGICGAVKYRIALELKKRNVSVLKDKMWKFRAKKRNFDFYIRPFEADVFLIRELILGRNMDGIGEYDVASMKEYFCEKEAAGLNIIDAGANIGLFTLLIASKYPGAKIFAIEPDENNFEVLHRNCENYPNVVCINAGVWSEECNLKLLNPGCESMSFRFGKSDGEEGIYAIDLQTLMKKYDLEEIDILKMDIEGSEKEVFENSSSWYTKVSYYLVEMHDRYMPGCKNAVETLLRKDKYDYDKHGENYIYIKRDATELV